MQGRIRGQDAHIVAPVQTADPDNYGGRSLLLSAGLNFAAASGPWRGHRLALELGWPVYQDLHGLQLQQQLALTAGWQYAWQAAQPHRQ